MSGTGREGLRSESSNEADLAIPESAREIGGEAYQSRRPYETPTLIELGHVTQLTGGSGSQFSDGGGHAGYKN
jgi:hypothetical protein